MRIVIDMQGAQSTGSRNRGIGRYTQSLAQAIVANRGQHEVLIALNGAFSGSITPIRAAFEGLLPAANIRVWSVPGPASMVDDKHRWRRKTGELVREAFLASLRPDVVLVTSLFEGLGDDAVTSVGVLSRAVPTAVILYDLIPLIQRHHYLQNPVVEAWYENKLDHLRRASMLLAISESSRQEGILHLGFSATDCVAISTAADAHFRPLAIGAEEEAAVRARYGLTRPFVMYTGGIDHRKNIEGLIRAYAQLPVALRSGHQLAIVCSIQVHSRHELESLAHTHQLGPDELVLTGFVPEEDLLALYNLCCMFVFPSWHEGFGLPALEAMSCGKAVIGANTSSLPEVIGREDALFDPRSDSAIARKIEQVLTDDAFRADLERHGIEQARQFSWEASARRTIAAMEAHHAARPVPVPHPAQRPTLAFVSPLPSERSGIADYSAELLPELARHYDIDVVAPQGDVTDPWIRANCVLRDPAWFSKHGGRYDRVLYHFGNSHFHQHMFDLLDDVPGVVVLHDFFLSGVVAHMDLTGFEAGKWTRSLYESHGYPAVRHRFHAQTKDEVVWRYPANLPVLRSALSMIVHSENARQLASQWYPSDDMGRWDVIPLLRVPETGQSKADARSALGFSADDFVVCSFGMLGPTKLNHRLLDAWLASGLADNARCVLVFVGENEGGEYGAALLETIRAAGARTRISITGWTDLEAFRQYLAAADVGVQLRALSRGETSAAALDCMNYGLATVVNANGSMADLPGAGVIKLPDDFADEELVATLRSLWQDPAACNALGTAGRELVRTAHAPRTCADQYAEAIESSYRAAFFEAPMLPEALAKVEPAPAHDAEWAALAQSMASSIPPRYRTPQLLVDVSHLARSGPAGPLALGNYGSLDALLAEAPVGFRVEPVYRAEGDGYRYACQFTLQLLDCPMDALHDEPAEFFAGDLLLVPAGAAQDATGTHYEELASLGVRVEHIA